MKRIRKFEMRNYIPNLGNRLDGIHFQDQKQIVTDGHYLIAVQCFYPKGMEGMTLDKNFQPFGKDVKFPKWENAIPDISTGYKSYDFSVGDLSIMYRLKGNSIRIKDSEKVLGYISPYLMDVMIEFMNRFICSARVYVPDDKSKAWKIVTESTENFMVLMPRMEEQFIPYEYDINRKCLTIFK